LDFLLWIQEKDRIMADAEGEYGSDPYAEF
jgi:hypothetical protein